MVEGILAAGRRARDRIVICKECKPGRRVCVPPDSRTESEGRRK